MAAPKINSKSPTIRRIMREAAEISSSPSPDYAATPLETDLFEWHFTLRGPPNSPYADGIYHGRIVLPPSYPLRPPSFRFVTPSGRFETNREICLSISGHHEETWQPAWGVRTALVALRSFMETDPRGQLGGLDTPEAVRRQLATRSRSFRCGACGPHTNADILAQCEEAARSAAGEGPSEDVHIPAELKMGWRDEMDKKKDEGEGEDETPTGTTGNADGQPSSLDIESSELAEGFVQTAPAPAPALARPAQEVPQPTRTVPAPSLAPTPTTAPVPAAQTQQRRGASEQAAPAWLDQLIMVVGVLLVAMVLKVFLFV